MNEEIIKSLGLSAKAAEDDLLSLSLSLAMVRNLPANSSMRRMSEAILHEAAGHADAFTRAHAAAQAGDFDGVIKALEQPVLH